MKTTFLKSVIPLFLIAVTLSSCTDDDPVTFPPLVEASSLAYAEGGVALAYVTNPYASASSNTIFGNNGTTNIIEIKLSSLLVGVYTIGEINKFKYTRVGTTSPWNAISGTITIETISDNKVTGFFNLTAGNSDLGINTVSGKFINVVINP